MGRDDREERAVRNQQGHQGAVRVGLVACPDQRSNNAHSAHGQLRSVRLHKILNHCSRGSTFLKFASKHEAENALNSFQHSHLLARHSVLQWAEENGHDVDELRRKAHVGHGGGGEFPGKKRKLAIEGWIRRVVGVWRR